jgi:sec-independent protein translocase protein TatA
VPNIGPMELAVVLLIALIFVGPKKLPGLGRSIGSGLREFKDTLSGTDPRSHISEVVSDIRAEVDPRVVDKEPADDAEDRGDDEEDGDEDPVEEAQPHSSRGTSATD